MERETRHMPHTKQDKCCHGKVLGNHTHHEPRGPCLELLPVFADNVQRATAIDEGEGAGLKLWQRIALEVWRLLAHLDLCNLRDEYSSICLLGRLPLQLREVRGQTEPPKVGPALSAVERSASHNQRLGLYPASGWRSIQSSYHGAMATILSTTPASTSPSTRRLTDLPALSRVAPDVRSTSACRTVSGLKLTDMDASGSIAGATNNVSQPVSTAGLRNYTL